ncbi:uncharacterized protein DUF937 [Cricetibacter osteomyelitidis]|uniref:Uncharacterized protein DUF937 n=1 Tax=Cricetibacter osteomyelitidis TaxID=1521931 RepID=A0A4R2T5F3_9PAST|nr:YidB family protein [Cricetibacter osteomyelitidis]TCP97640.1 uncharacterized protein DUF937 [Cricetibacter osteomyelitidis]
MLDKIIGSAISSALGGGNTANENSNSSPIGSILGGLIQSQGGVEGIFGKLQQGGLGDLLESWIGTGQNKPMQSNQVNDVFGDDTISEVAQQAGVDKTQAQDILSQALPQIIDMLTPNGREGGVRTDSLARQAQQAQSQDGFGLDDLLGGVLGGLFGEGAMQEQAQPTQTQQRVNDNPFGDILGQIFNQPTLTSQTSEPSSNDELAQDIGSILNGMFKNK